MGIAELVVAICLQAEPGACRIFHRQQPGANGCAVIQAAIVLTGEDDVPGDPVFETFEIEAEPAPDEPGAAAAVVTGSTVALAARPADDGRTYRLIFKRGTTAQSYAAATLLESVRCLPGGPRVEHDDVGVTPGDWKYWFASENRTGVLCDSPVSLTRTVS